MPYQGLIFAAVLGVGLALAIGVFIASTQWEQPQSHGEDSRRQRREYDGEDTRRRRREYDGEDTRRRRREYDYNRRENENYEQVTCPICQDNMPCNSVNIRILRCKHKYHTICIQKWFIEQSANGENQWCPVCRKPARM